MTLYRQGLRGQHGFHKGTILSDPIGLDPEHGILTLCCLN